MLWAVGAGHLKVRGLPPRHQGTDIALMHQSSNPVKSLQVVHRDSSTIYLPLDPTKKGTKPIRSRAPGRPLDSRSVPVHLGHRWFSKLDCQAESGGEAVAVPEAPPPNEEKLR